MLFIVLEITYRELGDEKQMCFLERRPEWALFDNTIQTIVFLSKGILRLLVINACGILRTIFLYFEGNWA